MGLLRNFAALVGFDAYGPQVPQGAVARGRPLDDSATLDPAQAMAQGSTAWADMSTWLAAQIKYNPDELVGRKGYAIWNRMMVDEQVKAAVQFRRAAVTGRDWFFELDPDESGLAPEECARRIDVNKCMIESLYRGPFADGLNIVMKAQWQGSSWTEIMVDQFEHDGKTYYGLRQLRSKPYETFFPHVDEYGDVLKWVQRRLGTGAEREIDPTKFVHYVNAPEMDEHFGQSELRAAYRWWFAKDFTIKYMNVFAERLAGGFVVVRPTDNFQGTFTTQSPEFKSLQNALTGITGSTSMILPAGFEAEVHYAPGSQVGVYDIIIGLQDLAIAKAVLLPNLLGMSNPKAQTGSHSQGGMQFDVFVIVSDDDADRLADCLNEQVFRPLNETNFADGVGPMLRFKPISEAKRQALLTTWGTLVTAKAVEPSDTDEAHVRDLLDFPEKGEPLVDPVAQAAAIAAAKAPPGGDAAGAAPGDGARPKPKAEMSAERRAAFARAEKRVHFQVIERQTDGEQRKWHAALEAAVADMVAEGVARIEQERLGSDQRSTEAVGRFDLDGMKARAVNTQVSRMLRSGMAIGEDHARREIDAAKKERFARRLDAERLGDLAAEWMKQKAFAVAGDLKAGAVKEIKNVLVNGLKYNRSQQQVTKNIYAALVNRGYLTGATAAEALGVDDTPTLARELELQGDLTAARLATVVRTNMFEAINEARFDAFTDPVLDGFVSAMQYSAILDSRTTAICEHMDGRTYTNDQWEGDLRPWVPPNHFNCRSLLVPVTALDESELTHDLPRIEPQEGFG